MQIGASIAETATSQEAPGRTIVLRGRVYYPPADGAFSRVRDQRRARHLSFVPRRARVIERRVATSLVVEHLHVLEQLPCGFVATVESLAQFSLHRREERFHHGVVVTIAAPAHAAHDAVCRELRLVILAGVRAALVGMMQQPAVGTPAF